MSFLLIWLFLVLFVLKCTSNETQEPPRQAPHYQGVDQRAMPLLKEYVKLAHSSNINFTNHISIGFLDIKRQSRGHSVVGTCFFGPDFREIEIDNEEWNKHPQEVRKNLLFHELIHCLCNRDHDFGDGERYYPINVEDWLEYLHGPPFHLKKQGSYSDDCPLSIMYPRVLPKRCMGLHEKEYLKEMFNRCQAW